MTPFIFHSNDKFSTTNTVWTANAGNICQLISLRYHSSETGDAILLDLQYSGSGDQPHIDQGNLFLLINGTKRYSFVPHLNQPASASENFDFFGNKYISWNESVYYEISEEILREMAYAYSVEFKVTGASVAREVKEDGERPSFIIIAKALYNAIFDNSAFIEDLKNEKQRLEGAKVEAELIEQEWKELKKKCEQHNSRMGAFVGRGCSWDATTEKFIEKFGKEPGVLYHHLEYAIPLFESLLHHMNEYNSKYPKTKVEIDYEVTEPEIRKFIAVLKQSRDNLSTKKYKKYISYDSHLKDVVRKSDWEDLNNLIWAGGIAGTIFVGGIWSLVISSWKPMIWFGVVTVILGSFSLYMRSYYDSKIEEYNSTHK